MGTDRGRPSGADAALRGGGEERHRRTDVVVRFEDEGEGRPRDVHGTVLPLGGDDKALPFHGWLQLLGHLENVSGRPRPGPDELTTPPPPLPRGE